MAVRVADVDMSNRHHSCPGNFNLISTPIRTCGGLTTPGCASVKFGISYSRVCGRLRGYQVGSIDGFGPYVNDQTNTDLIMDGILISHGDGLKHVWAYTTGNEKVPVKSFDTSRGNVFCPCADYRFNGTISAIIGNDYYCDSGVVSNSRKDVFYPTPLWTGQGCASPSLCCS